MEDTRYEDRFGAVARAAWRVTRALRWPALGLLGLPRSLLIELGWRLGDEIMALPVIDALQARYPDVRIQVITNFPDIYEGYPVAADREAPSTPPDRYCFLRDAPRAVYRTDHYAALAGVAAPQSPPELRLDHWETPFLDGLNRPIVALARGASWPTKRWPTDRWNTLSARLRHAGCKTVVLGVAAESIDADLDLVGRTTVREAACVLHHADLLVCCDSGLMHLGLAAGTRVVALFGPTDPDCYVRHQPRFHPLRAPTDCAGFYNHSPEPPPPGRCPLGHAACLTSVSVDVVFNQAVACLGEGD